MRDVLADLILISNETIVKFIISMALAIILGLLIATVYRYTHRGLNYEISFLSTLVLISPLLALVMFFIQNNLVLSLGLIGSLSIVRFRTPIKDTKDMIYLFWAIATGIGCGTLNWTVTILAGVILALLQLIFYLIKYGRPLHAEYILIIKGNDKINEGIIDYYSERIDMSLRNYEIDGETWEKVYELRFYKKHLRHINSLVEELKQDPACIKVSLLTPQLTLPM